MWCVLLMIVYQTPPNTVLTVVELRKKSTNEDLRGGGGVVLYINVYLTQPNMVYSCGFKKTQIKIYCRTDIQNFIFILLTQSHNITAIKKILFSVSEYRILPEVQNDEALFRRMHYCLLLFYHLLWSFNNKSQKTNRRSKSFACFIIVTTCLWIDDLCVESNFVVNRQTL